MILRSWLHRPHCRRRPYKVGLCCLSQLTDVGNSLVGGVNSVTTSTGEPMDVGGLIALIKYYVVNGETNKKINKQRVTYCK